MSLPHFRIVMSNTSHPGNIGAVARAMKNMALSELFLVNPRQFPDPEATAYVTAPVPLPPVDERLTVAPTLTVDELGTTVIADCVLFATAEVVKVRVLDNAVSAFLRLSTFQ